MKMKAIKLYLNYAGHCFASAKHVVKRDKDEMIKFHALFALLPLLKSHQYPLEG